MTSFMNADFLLKTETAKKLYHEHAEKMPIIDYPCHINPQEIYEDKRYNSITEVWLGGDHYKWRAMRTNGVDERFCTGKDTSDWEKFEKWAGYKFRPEFIVDQGYHNTMFRVPSKEFRDFIEFQQQEVCAPERTESISPLEHLEAFYQLQNNQPLTAEQAAFCQALIEEIWKEGEDA